MPIRGTRTEKNLLTAFCGESQARNRYTYYSAQAKKEGLVQMSKIFAETADHERAHAKSLFKLLEGGEVEITARFPAGVIGSTAENLREAAAGEHFEHSQMYPEFAAIAEEEGLPAVALLFRSIARAEQYHEHRYLKLLANLDSDQVFKKPQTVTWVCQNCGYQHEGNEAPDACPACAHARAHFELVAENY